MKPLVIFEIANNHMGDLRHFQKIIDRYFEISEPYRDKIEFALKFQFRNLETFIHEKFKNSNHQQVKRFEDTKLKDNDWKKIIRKNKKNFLIGCTAFDEDSVIKINKFKFDFLKIASCSMNDWSLLDAVYKKNKIKNIFCSLAGGSEKNISDTISYFDNRKVNVKYFYCVGIYPTKQDELNLSFFNHLQETYGKKIIGFSSHELPSEKLTGAMAIAMGARVFEKHVAVNTKKYEVNKYSTTPLQMNDWLKNLYESFVKYGSVSARNNNLKKEKQNLLSFKRGVFLKANIFKKKGEQIYQKDIYNAFPTITNQVTADESFKFNKIYAKKNIYENQPILRHNLKIINSRSEIDKIKDEIKKLILRSGAIILKRCRLEISHHYGIKKFYKYGMTMITIINSKYCKKLLMMFKNQEHPSQYHLRKQETFFILYGKVKLKLKINKKNVTKILKTGDLITIKQREIHSFKCLSKNGCIIEELSTKSIKNDSFYIDKKISKNKFRKSFVWLN